MLIRLTLLACILALPIAYSAKAAENPKVAVSIKPLHSLVAALMTGVGEPDLIVPTNHSPHTFNLKPSGARALIRADVVVWGGPGLELFLEKPLKALSGKSIVVTLVDDPAADPHVWLSPALAGKAVEHIRGALTKADPGNREAYTRNAEHLKTRLRDLQSLAERTLSPLRKKPFLVFHDAWGHFASSFGLSIAGAVALNPDRPPGAKRISAIRDLIGESGARCLFKEPQFNSPLLKTILEDQDDMKVFELDPLGANFATGEDLYFKMMESNIAAVATCLN